LRLATPEQQKEIEAKAFSEYKVTAELLMEVAGSHAAREIELSFLPELQSGRVAVVSGPGNNGADGLVAARFLHSFGYQVSVFYLAPKEERSSLFETQLTRAILHGVKTKDLAQQSSALHELLRFPLIVDALFGTGLKRPVDGQYAEIIKILNTNDKPVVSLDVPSGLDAATGQILGVSVRATMTITLGLSKPGFYTGSGPEHAGRIRILTIGLPRRLLREKASTHFAFNERLARRWIPARHARSNKSHHGQALIIAGSPTMWGAAHMAVEGAFRMGAGYVTLAVEAPHLSYVKEAGAEAKIIGRDDPDLFSQANVILIGPGAGANDYLKKLIEKALTESVPNVILDADAITVLGRMSVDRVPKSWVITPHAGELSRLIGVSAEEIEQNRWRSARQASERFGCNVLLKGFRTILSSPEGHQAVVLSGNAALAKAGSGDVLSGFIAGLMAQGVGSVQAAGTAAYIHGRIADDWLRAGRDVRALMPRDLLTLVPRLVDQIAKSQGT